MAGGSAGHHVRRRIERIVLGDGGGPTSTGQLPMLVLSAPQEGPVVAITANVHGDEVTGLAAVHALDRQLRHTLVRGTCVLVPSLNQRGLMMQRRVQPEDGLDLNRAFPGNPRGQGATRVAGLAWQGLMRRPLDALVDLHADSAVAIPYAIVDRATSLSGDARRAMDSAMLELATASGLTVLHEYPDDLYVKFRLDRSLAGAMVNHGGVPAVTLEVGPRRAVSVDAVGTMVDAVLRILALRGLVEDAPAPKQGLSGGLWRRSAAPRVRAAGVFVPALAPGRTFDRGDILGEVRAVDGTVREVVSAPEPGIVVSWTENAWIDVRGVPGTLGLAAS